MKISPEHFAILKAACEETLAAHPGIEQQYKDQGFGSMRFNWDVLYASKINGDRAIQWVCDVLYPAGLNDTHVNTALKTIMGNDGLSAKEAKKKSAKA